MTLILLINIKSLFDNLYQEWYIKYVKNHVIILIADTKIWDLEKYNNMLNFSLRESWIQVDWKTNKKIYVQESEKLSDKKNYKNWIC